MKKYVIGISAFYHDSSVCLFSNGELIFACEEEKFTGIKHDDRFPDNALEFIYRKFKITKENVEAVCYYEDPKLKLKRVIDNSKKNFFNNPLHSIRAYFKIKNNINELNKRLPNISDNVFYSTHHESHLYYSYYTSYFDKAVALSIDGVGEIDTMAVGIPTNTGLDYCQLSSYPHSLGLFYSAMTSYLGFRPNEGEYKVMGLASYGTPDKYIGAVRKLITYKNSKLECNMDVFCWDRSDKIMFNHKLQELLQIEQRLPEEPIEVKHMNLASAVQKRYEEILFDVLKSINIFDDSTNLCLAGGCAYNGTANGKITNKTRFNHLWIPVAPSDAGSAVGSCINYFVKNKKLKGKVSRNPFIGPFYSEKEILNSIKGIKHKRFHSMENLTKFIASKIHEGKVIGWFQGHIEFGSRALGNRSILADPTVDGMKDRINKVIKKREGFRPFAPVVIKEKQHEFFEVTDDVPFMNQVVKVKPEYVDKLKAVTHVDKTARIQTVYKHTLIHDLLLRFEELSGFPVLLNTSFNIKDKTMVLTPKDAVETFYDTDMDILVMNNIVIFKNL
jgi:carbamoyltransferase